MGFIVFLIKKVMLPPPCISLSKLYVRRMSLFIKLKFSNFDSNSKVQRAKLSTRSIDLFHMLSFPSYTNTLINERLVQICIVAGRGLPGLHSVF